MPTGAWLYSYFALWLLLAVECVALVLVVRQVGRLYSYWLKNDPDWGLLLGSLAPALPEVDLYGRSVSLAAPRGKKTVLFFVTPGCRACDHAIALVGTSTNPDEAEVVLVAGAGELKTKLFVSQYGRDALFPEVSVIADPEGKASSQYKAIITPYTVVVDTRGRVAAKGSVTTGGEVWLLMNQADRLGRAVPSVPGIPVLAMDGGDPVPGGS